MVVDDTSLQLIHGSTVDFAEELIGASFQLKNNPQASSDCGCGTSFDVKS